MAAALASTLHVAPLEFPPIEIHPCHLTASTIVASIASPCASCVVMTCVVRVELLGRPLQIRFACIDGLNMSGNAAARIAWFISANVLVSVIVNVEGRPSDYHTAHVSARPSSGDWIARVLIHPTCWTGAASVTVTSLTLAEMWPSASSAVDAVPSVTWLKCGRWPPLLKETAGDRQTPPSSLVSHAAALAACARSLACSRTHAPPLWSRTCPPIAACTRPPTRCCTPLPCLRRELVAVRIALAAASTETRFAGDQVQALQVRLR